MHHASTYFTTGPPSVIIQAQVPKNHGILIEFCLYRSPCLDLQTRILRFPQLFHLVYSPVGSGEVSRLANDVLTNLHIQMINDFVRMATLQAQSEKLR